MNRLLQISTQLQLILAETPKTHLPPFWIQQYGTVASLTWNFFSEGLERRNDRKPTLHIYMFVLWHPLTTSLLPILTHLLQACFQGSSDGENIHTHLHLKHCRQSPQGQTPHLTTHALPSSQPTSPHLSFLHFPSWHSNWGLQDINYIILHVCTLPSTRIVTAHFCWQSCDTFCTRVEALEV